MIAGSTTPLDRRQPREVGPFMSLPPRTGHPWPNPIGAGAMGHWGGEPRQVTLVDPTLVVEVSADTALERGRWRHVTKFMRARLNLSSAEISTPAER